MLTEALNFDFKQKLIDHIVLFYHRFFDFFQGKKRWGRLMNCLVNCPEFSLPKVFTKMKIIDWYFIAFFEGSRKWTSCWSFYLSDAFRSDKRFLGRYRNIGLWDDWGGRLLFSEILALLRCGFRGLISEGSRWLIRFGRLSNKVIKSAVIFVFYIKRLLSRVSFRFVRLFIVSSQIIIACLGSCRFTILG